MFIWLAECSPMYGPQTGMARPGHGLRQGQQLIFLAREFGVKVWATDLWIAHRNWQRIRDAVWPIPSSPSCRCPRPSPTRNSSLTPSSASMPTVLRHR